jgi:hypothetical protein
MRSLTHYERLLEEAKRNADGGNSREPLSQCRSRASQRSREQAGQLHFKRQPVRHTQESLTTCQAGATLR